MEGCMCEGGLRGCTVVIIYLYLHYMYMYGMYRVCTCICIQGMYVHVWYVHMYMYRVFTCTCIQGMYVYVYGTYTVYIHVCIGYDSPIWDTKDYTNSNYYDLLETMLKRITNTSHDSIVVGSHNEGTLHYAMDK